MAEDFIDKNYHATVICRGIKFFLFIYAFSNIVYGRILLTDKFGCFPAYTKALEDAIAALDKIAMSIDAKDRRFLHPIMFLEFALFFCFRVSIPCQMID